MTLHEHQGLSEREEFLIDGCERCKEYVANLGRSFDPGRFREFWNKMIEVEWDHEGAWKSKLDAELGRKLYLVSLSFQHAYGWHPRVFEETSLLNTLNAVATTPVRLPP